jgi:hypothetical protein
MPAKAERNLAVGMWGIVVVVGAVVLLLIAGLSLFPRLTAGQAVLDGLRPAFNTQRVAGDRAGINAVSKLVDAADPIVTAQGGAVGEVPQLVAFVSSKTGLTPTEVLGALQTNFPHTTALLQAIPLESVTSELPSLEAFLSKVLNVTPDQLASALGTNFPHLAQAITALPTVTSGWITVPGTENLTRFDGTPVRSVPDIRTYFSSDVIPVLESQRANFQQLDSGFPPVGSIAPILTVIGAVVVVYGLLMMLLFSRRRIRGVTSAASWGVVVLVGIVVLVLVGVGNLFPRLYGGQDLLNAAAPAFTTERVTGDVAGIKMVSTVVDLADPIMTTQGGASSEVPQLIAFVSSKTGLSPAQVLAALQTNFPHTTALLQAIPLDSISAELPRLITFLATTLNTTPAQVQAALGANFPHLSQSIAALPVVTSIWGNVPGSQGFTRFDGTPISTVPDVRTYFAHDVIAAVAQVQSNFETLDLTPPEIIVFPPLLTIVGAAVVIYGLLLIVLWPRLPFGPVPARTKRPGAGAVSRTATPS